METFLAGILSAIVIWVVLDPNFWEKFLNSVANIILYWKNFIRQIKEPKA